MPRSFPPVVGRNPKILILGSMPGAESLRRRQYYAHPRNQFWQLVGDALGEELEGLSYRRRLAVLKRRGVALWDTVAECERKGSLDSRIRRVRPNDVAGLVRRLGVRAVLLNGGKAREMFLRYNAEGMPEGVFVAAVPSSSPAAAAITFERKAGVWGARVENAMAQISGVRSLTSPSYPSPLLPHPPGRRRRSGRRV